jgi:hypothetical protein
MEDCIPSESPWNSYGCVRNAAGNIFTDVSFRKRTGEIGTALWRKNLYRETAGKVVATSVTADSFLRQPVKLLLILWLKIVL